MNTNKQMRNLVYFLSLFLLSISALAQKKAPENWHNLDPTTDKIWGVSTEKAYKEILPGKGSRPVIVAVIDGGTDFKHEDLILNIWRNQNEVEDSKFDEDRNGYTDDIYGWNFIGGPEENVDYDTYEFTRTYKKYKAIFEGDGSNNQVKSPELKKLYDEAELQYLNKSKNIKRSKIGYDTLLVTMEIIRKRAGSLDPSAEALKPLKANGRLEKISLMLLKQIAKTGGRNNSPIQKQLNEGSDYFKKMVDYHLNLDFEPRAKVGDDYENVKESRYGNNKISGPKAEHGTHVSGIIAANRNNGLGVKGICENAKIMTLRAVPDGDERDKDIANSIRYAVDNGAKVINMSFGKSLSPDKKAVDDAVKYALSKDVLLIHAAGNDSKNLETEKNYPSAKFEGLDFTAPNWIEVGASSWEGGKKLTAEFSNYGKNSVDVFAPGVDINSTMPENKYEAMSGTSMAAPVVAGVAALVRSYYPMLTAVQVKKILEKSAIPYTKKVKIPGSKKKTKLKELCRTGAIVNAYEALKLAELVASGKVTL